MNPSSIDVKDILCGSRPLGLVFAKNLFIAREPVSPHNCVTIYDTNAFPPQLTFNRLERYEFPSIQIRIRNSDFREGWDLADKIKILLHGRANETWNGTLYSIIKCSGGPALLGRDDNDRFLIYVNFEIQRR
jgi:hypothetical protein